MFIVAAIDGECARALLEGSDACVAPVLDMDEAPKHPHNRARGTFIEVGGVVQQTVWPLLNDFARIPVCGLIAQYNSIGKHPNVSRSSFNDHLC